MLKKIQFETDEGVALEAEVYVQCRYPDGTDLTYDIEWLGYAGTNSKVKFESLSPADQKRLNSDAEDAAWASTEAAAAEYGEGHGDWTHTMAKDRDL